MPGTSASCGAPTELSPQKPAAPPIFTVSRDMVLMVQVVERPARERFEPRATRPVGALGAPAPQLPAREPPGGRRTRPQAQLVVEPPGPRVDRLAVGPSELVRSDAERLRAEHAAQHCQCAGEDARRLAIAVRRKRIERDLYVAPGHRKLHVS